MRIISLLPSATEMVCCLGLGKHLVGVTHECDHPAFVTQLPRVTRTAIPKDASSADIDRLVRERLQTQKALYTLDIPTLQRLKPDLIVTQGLCDVCAVAEDEVRTAAESLSSKPKIINLQPMSLSNVLDAIQSLAEFAGVKEAGELVGRSLWGRVNAVADRSKIVKQRPRVAFLEWLDPFFSGGHWNPELVRLAGGDEVLGVEGKPSRTATWDQLLKAQPEVIFIASCGQPTERGLQDLALLASKPEWQQLPAVKSGRVCVSDGSQYFNRPGPRLVDSLEILAHALHPQVHPIPDGLTAATIAR